MTAEAVIMNKGAVAMAADSAVTLGGGKVFNTANKVFALSKCHPVGLMIYGNAEFMGVPWETLVKMFRRWLGRRSCDTVENYVSLLIEFLRDMVGPDRAFSEEPQREHFAHGVLGLFHDIRDEIQEEVGELLARGEEATEKDVEQVCSKVVRRHHDACKGVPHVHSLTSSSHREIRSGYLALLKELREHVFQQLPFAPSTTKLLYDLAASLFTKRPWARSIGNVASGVVIVGYGEAQVFPSLREYAFLGVVGGHLSFDQMRAIDIGADTHASILPFAQGRNMMARFMEGVDPDYQRLIENTLGNVFDKALDQTIDAIDELDAARKECYKRQAKLAGEQALSNYVGGLAESRQVYFVGPVMDVVASLPKDELAEMAESLVNLTSLKMRMSNDKETVGGPIDVAIISKGDGLVWTKRKHYFRPELNPHFFANYHREDDGDGCEAQAKGG
ncbi:MAG: hypothetical protein KBI47_14600 [Armatimonadetes bacterium]|nr:hypothetical protein [Armatimonadota bacterium]MDI9585408.1 hypothetical protein [Acidobacteriota bacterium]